MTQKKSKKTKVKPTSKWLKIVVGIVVLAFAAYFVFSGLMKNNKPEGNRKVIEGYTAFEFTKHGELTFTSDLGEYKSKVDIEIADDDEERATGMMYRNKMEEDQAMFFIFPADNYQSFWMRNTLIPLDIIYVNSKLEIVSIHKNTTPFSEQSYPSTDPAQYVVETIGGYCDLHGVVESDKIVWRRN